MNCTRCGRPVFGATEHPCCVRENAGPDQDCPACATSDALERQWQTSGKSYQRRVQKQRELEQQLRDAES